LHQKIADKIEANVQKDLQQDRVEIARRVSVDRDYLFSLTTEELKAELARRKSTPADVTGDMPLGRTFSRKKTTTGNSEGGAAWELLQSTNEPAAYKQATAVALQRHQTLRQTEGKRDKLLTRLSATGQLKRHLTLRADQVKDLRDRIKNEPVPKINVSPNAAPPLVK